MRLWSIKELDLKDNTIEFALINKTSRIVKHYRVTYYDGTFDDSKIPSVYPRDTGQYYHLYFWQNTVAINDRIVDVTESKWHYDEADVLSRIKCLNNKYL